jgi:hypothetical protein
MDRATALDRLLFVAESTLDGLDRMDRATALDRLLMVAESTSGALGADSWRLSALTDDGVVLVGAAAPADCTPTLVVEWRDLDGQIWQLSMHALSPPRMVALARPLLTALVIVAVGRAGRPAGLPKPRRNTPLTGCLDSRPRSGPPCPGPVGWPTFQPEDRRRVVGLDTGTRP